MFRPRWTTTLAAAMIAGVAVVLPAGCGEAERPAAYRVYVSMPLSGPHGQTGRAIRDAAELALERAGGDAGRTRIELVSLDSVGPGGGARDAAAPRAPQNALRAASDRRALAYIGELDSRSTARSIVRTHAAGLLQVSPTAEAAGLTDRAPGGGFVRVAPSDYWHGVAAVDYMALRRVEHVALIDAPGFAVRSGLATGVRDRLDYAGIDLVYAGDVAGAVARRPRWPRGTALLVASTSVAARRRLLMSGATGDLTAYIVDTTDGPPSWPVEPARAARYLITISRPAEQYPLAGKRFFEQFADRFGYPPPRLAIQGFEAMGTVLEAIGIAQDKLDGEPPTPAQVAEAALQIEDRFGPTGHFDVLSNGDTTPIAFGAYLRDGGGAWRFDRVIALD